MRLEKRYYITDGTSRERGPYKAEDIKILREAGRIDDSTHIRAEGTVVHDEPRQPAYNYEESERGGFYNWLFSNDQGGTNWVLIITAIGFMFLIPLCNSGGGGSHEHVNEFEKQKAKERAEEREREEFRALYRAAREVDAERELRER